MNKISNSRKWAAISLLRQGAWLDFGEVAVASLENADLPSKDADLAYLLPTILLPETKLAQRIGGTHYYIRPKNAREAGAVSWKTKELDPRAWDIVTPDENEALWLDAALSLVKNAALLPYLVIWRKLPGHVPQLKVTAEDFASWGRSDLTCQIVGDAQIPLAQGQARLVAFRPSDGGSEQMALIFGEPISCPLVRLHSQCFTGDVLGSQRCDCGQQLLGAMDLLSGAPQGGILLYLAQEGRGIGLVNKLRAYQLQDSGLDTLDANLHLGFGPDERDYHLAAGMLKALGFGKIRLLSNNPEKADSLKRHGIIVAEMVRHAFPPNVHNESYLRTKVHRFGHRF